MCLSKKFEDPFAVEVQREVYSTCSVLRHTQREVYGTYRKGRMNNEIVPDVLKCGRNVSALTRGIFIPYVV